MTGGTQSGPPSSATIDAVSQVFLESGVDIGEPRRRRERAATFCDSFGGVDEALLVQAYAEREATDGRTSGLLIHYLNDATRIRDVLVYMGAKSKHRKVGRHGAAPAIDLPDSPEGNARVAGYGGVEEWEAARTSAIMWSRWRFERCHLDYDDRLADIAAEFGYTMEDTYDILSAECQREYASVIGLR